MATTLTPLGYTTEQVCQLLQCSPTFIHNEVRAGRLVAFKIGRSFRFSQKALDEYIAGCIVKPHEAMEEEEEEEQP